MESAADTGLTRFIHEKPLESACRRLEALGAQWARAQGTQWHTVLNDGPLPSCGPSWGFRWQVVARTLAFAAGLGPAPLDYPALPLGLQAFLTWAVPAALRSPGPVAVDADAAARVLADSDRLLDEWPTAPAASDGGQDLPGSRLDPETGPGSVSGTDPGALLDRALSVPVDGIEPPGLAALRQALAAGPLSPEGLRALAEAHGVLPGTLLDALDREALRRTGLPAVRVEGDWLRGGIAPVGQCGDA